MQVHVRRWECRTLSSQEDLTKLSLILRPTSPALAGSGLGPITREGLAGKSQCQLHSATVLTVEPMLLKDKNQQGTNKMVQAVELLEV